MHISMRNMAFLLYICLSILLRGLSAKPNELAARLAQLSLDPANDERFNEIDSVPDDLHFHHKFGHILDKMATYHMDGGATETTRPTTMQEAAMHEEGEEQQQEAEQEAAVEDMMRAMVTTMFGFMGGLMRRFYN